MKRLTQSTAIATIISMLLNNIAYGVVRRLSSASGAKRSRPLKAGPSTRLAKRPVVKRVASRARPVASRKTAVSVRLRKPLVRTTVARKPLVAARRALVVRAPKAVVRTQVSRRVATTAASRSVVKRVSRASRSVSTSLRAKVNISKTNKFSRTKVVNNQKVMNNVTNVVNHVTNVVNNVVNPVAPAPVRVAAPAPAAAIAHAAPVAAPRPAPAPAPAPVPAPRPAPAPAPVPAPAPAPVPAPVAEAARIAAERALEEAIERARLEADRRRIEEEARRQREEEERLRQEHIAREEREEEDRRQREAAERVRLEEQQRLDRERREREEEELRQREQRERIAREQEEAERRRIEEVRLQREEEERRQREERERIAREAREAAERAQLQRAREEQAARDRLQIEEQERREREQREAVERVQLQRAREEQVRLQREQAERDRLHREEQERREREQREAAEEERIAREQRERLQREAEERVRQEEARRQREQEAERLRQQEAERVRQEEARRQMEIEAERLRQERIAREERAERERLQIEAQERLRAQQQDIERISLKPKKRERRYVEQINNKEEFFGTLSMINQELYQKIEDIVVLDVRIIFTQIVNRVIWKDEQVTPFELVRGTVQSLIYDDGPKATFDLKGQLWAFNKAMNEVSRRSYGRSVLSEAEEIALWSLYGYYLYNACTGDQEYIEFINTHILGRNDINGVISAANNEIKSKREQKQNYNIEYAFINILNQETYNGVEKKKADYLSRECFDYPYLLDMFKKYLNAGHIVKEDLILAGEKKEVSLNQNEEDKNVSLVTPEVFYDRLVNLFEGNKKEVIDESLRFLITVAINYLKANEEELTYKDDLLYVLLYLSYAGTKSGLCHPGSIESILQLGKYDQISNYIYTQVYNMRPEDINLKHAVINSIKKVIDDKITQVYGNSYDPQTPHTSRYYLGRIHQLFVENKGGLLNGLISKLEKWEEDMITSTPIVNPLGNIYDPKSNQALNKPEESTEVEARFTYGKFVPDSIKPYINRLKVQHNEHIKFLNDRTLDQGKYANIAKEYDKFMHAYISDLEKKYEGFTANSIIEGFRNFVKNKPDLQVELTDKHKYLYMELLNFIKKKDLEGLYNLKAKDGEKGQIGQALDEVSWGNTYEDIEAFCTKDQMVESITGYLLKGKSEIRAGISKKFTIALLKTLGLISLNMAEEDPLVNLLCEFLQDIDLRQIRASII